MNIFEEFTDIKKAIPKTLYVLQDTAGINTYYNAQLKKHPFTLYINSISTIADTIIETIHELEKVKKVKKHQSLELDWQLELIKATNRLLHTLFIHFNDCNLIIESFFENVNSNECKQSKNQFKKSVKSYYDHIAIPVNSIKHRSSQLRAFCFHWENDAIVGFFLQSPDNAGVLGPDVNLHKDGCSAFSFNRELPYFLVNIFATSSSLANVLHSINSKLSPKKNIIYSDVFNEKWLMALQKVSTLPKFYFPDEINKQAPLVKIQKNIVKIQFPAKNLKVFKQPSGSFMTLSSEGDALSESKHVIPYHDLIDKIKSGYVFANELNPKFGRIIYKS